MERQHLGTANNGNKLYGGYINRSTKVYYDSPTEGNLVAVATSPDEFENFVNYFCLPEIWDQQSDTSWVSAEKLKDLI